MKKHFTSILMAVLVLGGLGLLLYPKVSNMVSVAHSSSVVQGYVRDAAEIQSDELQAEWEKAVRYNQNLKEVSVTDPFGAHSGNEDSEYEQLLDVNGVMATLDIPKIHVNLPVYHGTSDEVLEKGVGHLEGTSLPVGGEGTHCVLSSHTGLKLARLFTDLEKLEIGDTFTLYVLDHELRYEIDDITIVEPWDTSPLHIFPGEDYVTLLTCTPYGINSHRLLVRGSRVEIPEEEERGTEEILAQAHAQTVAPVYILCISLVVILTAVLAGVWYRMAKKRKLEEKGDRE